MRHCILRHWISAAVATVWASLAFTLYLTHKKQQEIDPGWTKVPHWPCVIWKMDSGVLFHTLYVTITNSQPHKKIIVIIILFNLCYSRASKLRSVGQIRPANTFVKNEKLIDVKLFDLIECNIPETIPIRKMFGPRTFV